MKTTNQSRIFISYSRRGNGLAWKEHLIRHLGVFERHNLLDVWQDGKIRVSSYWDDDITQAMSSARLAVVLLTPEALQSQYIIEKEFPFLRERQQRDKLPVFPVICEQCDWKVHDWLRATQAPNESNPISSLTEAAQERIFHQLATDIATELSRVALAELPKSDQTPPSDHIYLEKFPLTRCPGLREEKLIGREQELALLYLAFAQPYTIIVSLIAWGGVGKTMLVQHWLQRLQREGWFGAQRVYAWSFYSQGTKEDRQASEDTFLAHALEWFGVQCEPTLSPWDKGRLLADAVSHERTLLILDGIEPLQYPPGPMGGQLRAPGVQSLLKHLARKANSAFRSEKPEVSNCLCLVTTREPLSDLADFQRREGSPWGSVLRVDLGNLTDDAGAALLHHAGANRAGAAEIKSDDKELFAASREVDGHALTLNLLGRFLARAHGGDIRRRDLITFEEADRKEQGAATFKMLAAFEKWFANEGGIEARALTVLRLLGLFDRPADAGCMGALRHPPVIAGLTDPLFMVKRDSATGQTTEQPLSDKAWNDATHFLADFGLIAVQTDPDGGTPQLDCHPLIREHFAKRVHKGSLSCWHAAHRRLYEYLKNGTEALPATIAGMEPLYHAVSHGCHAGDIEDALISVYWSRISRRFDFFSTTALGTFASDLQALRQFFERPWSQVSPKVSQHDQASVLNWTGFRLSALGRLEESLQPMSESLQIRTKQCNYDEMRFDLGNLSETSLLMGKIKDAIAYARRGIQCAFKRRWLVGRVASMTQLAHALDCAGATNEAGNIFAEAERNMKLNLQLNGSPVSFLRSFDGYRYVQFLLRSGDLGELLRRCREIIRQTIRLNEDTPDVVCGPRQTNRRASRVETGLEHLTLGQAALAVVLNGEDHLTAEAQSSLDKAFEDLSAASQQPFLPPCLLARASLRFLEGQQSGAQADLDEAWDIAERGPMRLHMADIHLYRTRLFHREKHYPWKSPQDDLAAAEKLINDCGYHRRDEELADAKRAIVGP